MEKLQAEEDAVLDRYLAELSSEQRQQFEGAAVVNGTKMQIESYYRLKPKGGPMFESLLKQLMSDHLSSK